MRAVRALSTRVGAVGAAVALSTVGLVGMVATAGPAGANTTDLGTTSCALSTGTQSISATVDSTISPSPVNAGNTFDVTGLALHSTLVANATTSAAAGKTLTVTFAAPMSATNATPATQTATFSGQVILPTPFNIGDTAPITLDANPVPFTAASSGATSSAVSLNPSGQLTATLGTLNITGACTGGAPVQINSVTIVPAAGSIRTLLPNAGPITGGTTVKLVGDHLGGASAVDFGPNPATSFQVLSPTLIEAVAPANDLGGSGDPSGTVDITVTTPAGPSKAQPNDVFTYVDTSQSSIVDSVTPSIGTSAGGTTVQISGAGFAGGDGSSGCDATTTAVAVGSTNLDPSQFTVNSDTSITATVPAGSGVQDVTVTGCAGFPSPLSPADQYNYNPGYILTASDGGIFSYGQVAGHAGFFGSAGSLTLNKPVVGIARTPNGNGYWQAAADGGVFAYGGAVFYGSAGNLTLNAPVVGIASTPDGAGYWEVAADGGIFSYGDALFYGSAGNIHLNQPIVGMAATADGKGYWLVAADGGVFAYGDAQFHGSAGNITLNQPIVGLAATSSGDGYWMVARDGGVFSYGGATFHGSLVGTALASPVVGIASTADNGGYWLLTANGAVFNQGDAGFYGDMAGLSLNGTMVGLTGVQAALPAA